MRLGKALATGLAEERVHPREDTSGIPELPDLVEESEAALPEEVPAGR
ncbi:hypothetical protein ACWEBX_26060 [Streptomyces sp. NPDC005070]